MSILRLNCARKFWDKSIEFNFFTFVEYMLLRYEHIA